MAERRLTVMISLSDPEHADELAHALAENDGVMVVMPSDLEQPDGFDVVVTDGEPVDGVTPHILLGDATGTHVHAALPADAEAALIGAAVRVAAAGYRLLPSGPGDVDNPHPSDADAANAHSHAALTPREMETLTLLADGASNKVIARQLKISVHTAKFHVAAVLTKLHAQNRADAVAIGLRQGLLYL
jgi:DNA-binding CsgD family transcriptional regulator